MSDKTVPESVARQNIDPGSLPREFWLIEDRLGNCDCFDTKPINTGPAFPVIHVIDYNAYVERDLSLQNRVKKLKEANDEIDRLKAHLAVAVEALQRAASNVTWFAKAADGNNVLHTYGYHVEACQEALDKINLEKGAGL